MISFGIMRVAEMILDTLLQLRSFFESHDAGSGDGAVKQAMEKIQADMDWLRRNEETIEGWMAYKIRTM